MRTTLDIDPQVLAAARARVNDGRNKSVGEAVSELALAGLSSDQPRPTESNGLVLLPAEPGHVVTDGMVARAMLDDE
ncbi:hypothetical protein GIY30_02950 [Gordonia sp. HNM0687]|uniref:Uncharacterized protein n=1 Tax=Gordonia mangrovi TaxID=2665643 RepID=A0A6L7GLL8_9ACTN|nr:hypothetical protein [Gordonia mangrovi]MXP20317.1 hypothetical protein [Gordonia mangrovi]UVF79082.1 hypothetical protein NWF22_04300 [Gordonia mangrovi]